jgi:rubrerythrin
MFTTGTLLSYHNESGGDITMATWKCACGFIKEGRCKPQKCEKCGEKGQFVKSE